MSILSNPRIQRLLDCFDTDTQCYLLDFCNRISNIKADVFIIMARKAACFFDCLEELGLIHFNGYVTSERILDMNTSWLLNKDVVIIDDAIVSGTSIYKTIQILKESRVKSISVHVLTVNEKWFQPDLLKENENTFLFEDCNPKSDAKCIELCFNIVNAILLQPRPYDIDFPMFRALKLNKHSFNCIKNTIGWSCFDVSTSIQAENNLFSLSIIPNDYHIKNISETIGFTLNDNCIMKLRVYGALISKKKKTYEIRIVPMVVLDKLKKEDVDRVFDTIIHASSMDELKSEFISYKSKLRLLQFYFAVKLYDCWFYDVSSALNLNTQVSYNFSERNLNFLFPKHIINKIEILIKDLYNLNIVDRKLTIHNDDSNSYSIPNFNPVSIKTYLTDPFLNMYYEKELLCRQYVKEYGKTIFSNDTYESLRNRLDSGITYAELKNLLIDYSNVCDISTLTSLFVDQAIDVGIAVPITQEDEHFVSRAYRHGEDVLFGKREEILYSEMLYQFQKATQRTKGLTHLSVEKMIVLFTRIGIKKKILKPYISNFTINPFDENGELYNILRVKTALMGPVSIIGNVETLKRNSNVPFITDESKSMWLTEVFLSKGIIYTNDANLYQIKKPDTSSVLEDYILETQNFSMIMGELFNKSSNTGINFSDDEIVKVCSCLTLPITIQSVGAEMHLFLSDWRIIRINGKNEKFDKSNLREFRTSIFFECINNALMKITAYDDKESKAIIDNVKFSQGIYQNIWKSYFNEDVDISQDNSLTTVVKKDVFDLYNNQRTWVYLFNTIIDLLYISIQNNYNLSYQKKQNSVIKKRIIRIQDFITKLKQHYKELKKTFHIDIKMIENLSETIISNINLKQFVSNAIFDNFYNIVLNAYKPTEMLLERMTCLIGQHGKINPFIIFNHISCVSFKCHNDKEYKERVYRINYCLNKQEGFGENVILLPDNYKPNVSQESAQVWIIAKGDNGYKSLLRIGLNILFSLKHNVSVVMFHDVGYVNAIKQSDRPIADYFCCMFYDFLQSFDYSSMFTVNSDPRFIYYISSHRYKKHNLIEYMESIKANNYYKLISENEISNSENIAFKKITYQLKGGKYAMEDQENKNIGIITILPEESNAVINQLKLVSKTTPIGSRLYYEGHINGKETQHSIVMTQQIDQGQQSVISAYYDMVNKFHPRIIFLVGIAGGIHADIDCCDVIIGNEIIGYDKQKDTHKGIQRRGSSFKINASVIPYIQQLQLQVTEKPLKSVKDSKSDIFSLFFENIGSGSAVIANKLSSITKWIHDYNDKVYAVEMEAYGLNSAFYEEAINSQSSTIAVCVIRGISDHADSKKSKDSNFRIPAANNAAIVLSELIKNIPPFEQSK